MIRSIATARFGTERFKLHLLSDAGDNCNAPEGVQLPTRENLKKAFAEVANAKDASPEDILVVYRAGHGVMSREASPSTTT